MQRRDFITLIGGVAATWSLAARAQQTGMIWRIGFLAGGLRPAGLEASPYAGFIRGMHELGYADGKDFVMEWRFAEGRPDLYPELAGELVRLKVDVIVLGTPQAVPAAQQASRQIPIVMGDSTDPVGRGFIASLAHPGGNITGVSSSRDDVIPKQLELLARIAPNLERAGIVMNPSAPGDSNRLLLKIVEASAPSAKLEPVPVQISSLEDVPTAFATLGQSRVGGALFFADPFFFSQRQRIAELAVRSRLPTMFTAREYAEAGGLMSYGQSLAEHYRRAASYVDRIFKGAKPADLPVEQPTKFDFVINRRTSDRLGITIPPALYIFADDVIE